MGLIMKLKDLLEAKSQELKKQIDDAIKAASSYISKTVKENNKTKHDNHEIAGIYGRDDCGPIVSMKDGQFLILMDEPLILGYNEDRDAIENTKYDDYGDPKSANYPKPWYVIVKGKKVIKAIDGSKHPIPII
jgi:hypothetical protein